MDGWSHKCDDDHEDDDQCARRRMCVKIIYSHNCCSLLIISSTNGHDYYLASLYCQSNAEGVTTATRIVEPARSLPQRGIALDV
jgi:hypothetical protein